MNNIEILNIKNYPVESNCFLVFDSQTKYAIVIDPGSDSCNSVIEYIEDYDLSVEYIILTHEHFDHIWGVNVLKERYNCQIVCSKECAEKIVDKRKNLSEFYNQKGFETYNADIKFNSNAFSIKWHDYSIELAKTKGHSEGSICVMINNNLFSGDTVIKNMKTVVKLPDSSRIELKKSLGFIQSICTDKTIIYPGHGDSFKFENSIIEKCL